MGDNIPFEIQVEIIKWLPVKLLVVFRSVSKAWKSMIDSPLFITDHTNLRRHHRLLIRYGIVDNLPDHLKFESDMKYVSIVDNDSLSQHKFNTVSNVPVSFQRLKKLDLVGTSQGLLCLFTNSREDGCYKETAVIWNPSLGKSIAIDVPCQGFTRATVLGFGVRPDNCDPMIIVINDIARRCPVLVYTLSSRGWRIPHGNLLPKSNYFSHSSSATTDDRCIYWQASDGGINLVVAFDMVSEDFTEIHLPNDVAHRLEYNVSISMIKDSLALLDYDVAKKPVCHVRKMVEDGVSKSFTKLFTINTPHAPFNTKVLGFRKNDQPIMATTTDWVSASVEVYEPRTGTIKNLGINGERCSFFCCSYTETLILLDQLDGSNL